MIRDCFAVSTASLLVELHPSERVLGSTVARRRALRNTNRLRASKSNILL
jgi:hypothetical protein